MSHKKTCVLIGLAAFGVAAAQAQTYPSRPVRIIVPYPPGASTDFTARLMGGKLQESLGQPFIVDNRGGAGGAIAAELAARATPDGHTLFFGTPAALCITPAIRGKVPYDAMRDFVPINRLVVNAQVMVALPSFPANSVADLIKMARAEPGKYIYASVGVGSPQHLGFELLKARAKIDLVHVAYKGGGPAMTDALAGRVQVYMGSIPGILPHIRSGKLKPIGLGGRERSKLFPGVATIAETVPGYEFVGTWYGILTQTGVQADIVSRLNAELTKALRSEDVRQQLLKLGSDPQPMSVEDFQQFVRSDCPNWANAVRVAGAAAK
jgi:tripartite-type tricarboxylate transporter receptor subunit TctC